MSDLEFDVRLRQRLHYQLGRDRVHTLQVTLYDRADLGEVGALRDVNVRHADVLDPGARFLEEHPGVAHCGLGLRRRIASSVESLGVESQAGHPYQKDLVTGNDALGAAIVHVGPEVASPGIACPDSPVGHLDALIFGCG